MCHSLHNINSVFVQKFTLCWHLAACSMDCLYGFPFNRSEQYYSILFFLLLLSFWLIPFISSFWMKWQRKKRTKLFIGILRCQKFIAPLIFFFCLYIIFILDSFCCCKIVHFFLREARFCFQCSFQFYAHKWNVCIERLLVAQHSKINLAKNALPPSHSLCPFQLASIQNKAKVSNGWKHC